ncbi:hypothetical protein FLM9_645 [Candidatus Synechococcus spongiarum]|uniref:Uncharacterized protein n=1 Tax=Candidatus Synechococcus spongiarum TaxID=431041 RepID=A0A170T6W6_9SYNE|nr:hypothetical protein FLM9_645 [Candidatus Synechococcus spongiarum]
MASRGPGFPEFLSVPPGEALPSPALHCWTGAASLGQCCCILVLGFGKLWKIRSRTSGLIEKPYASWVLRPCSCPIQAFFSPSFCLKLR